jgi:hypothetical protein
MTDRLEKGYWEAYKNFYRWSNIFRGARAQAAWSSRLRHVAYAGGWKKFEPLWDAIIRVKQTARMLPLLETILEDKAAHRAGGMEPEAHRSPAPAPVTGPAELVD